MCTKRLLRRWSPKDTAGSVGELALPWLLPGPQFPHLLHEGVRLGLYVFFNSCLLSGFTFPKEAGAGKGEGRKEEKDIDLSDSLRSLPALGSLL